MDTDSGVSQNQWRMFGYRFPKAECVFFAQTLILYTVIITSLINLTLGTEPNAVWCTLLSSCLGYMLPNPSIKKAQIVPNVQA